jgi:hypothetical protein
MPENWTVNDMSDKMLLVQLRWSAGNLAPILIENMTASPSTAIDDDIWVYNESPKFTVVKRENITVDGQPGGMVCLH